MTYAQGTSTTQNHEGSTKPLVGYPQKIHLGDIYKGFIIAKAGIKEELNERGKWERKFVYGAFKSNTVNADILSTNLSALKEYIDKHEHKPPTTME